jgi:hypothetical protein
MLEPEQISIKIDIPVDFIEACEIFGVEPQKALQYFLDHLSVYSHLTKRGDNPKSVASTIFNNYLERRGCNPEPDYAKRAINVHYVRKVVHLIQTRFSKEEKESFCEYIIAQWYQALQS